MTEEKMKGKQRQEEETKERGEEDNSDTAEEEPFPEEESLQDQLQRFQRQERIQFSAAFNRPVTSDALEDPRNPTKKIPSRITP
jgi:hypothetical protein